MLLLEGISISGDETIPRKKSAKIKDKGCTKNNAGWKEYVEPFQDEARFWFAIWVSAGKPVNTVLHSIMKSTQNKYHYQIRKCKRVEEFLINNKIIQNCLENDDDLFSEIKKHRGMHVDEEVTIDGTSGENIPKKFASIYEELFNRENDDENISHILNEINQNLGNDDLKEINRVNPNLVKEAIGKLKPDKSDPIWDFSTDFFKAAPDILYYHLAEIIKAFLVHGHVSQHLLLASLVPLVKDKLADLCSSSNYRSIALSSIFLKLLDWVVIICYGHLLKLDDLQFGFQKENSTSLCSWMVFETIDHYIRNGSIVYGVLMDCTKAFDTIQHSKLFKKMLDANVPGVVVRLLIHIYRRQKAEVRWKDSYSDKFSVKNGVRQGAILSPILFCFYMNDLFGLLRDTKSGCHIGNYFAGAMGYADDLLLLCPSRKGLQEMLNIAESYASDHKISFSTHHLPEKSKTKGIVFSKKELNWSPAPLILCNNPLPWVKNAKYLGNFIGNIVDGLSKDVRIKRARFIEKNCELLQEFPLAHPEVKCKINRIYNSSFPGSVLWDLSSKNVQQLINSWSVSTRQMWDLPMDSHRYFMEELGGTHAKTMLYSRFVTFIQSLGKHSKFPVQFLLNLTKENVMSITGRNIRQILAETGQEDIFKVKVSELKRNFKFYDIQNEDKWKVTLIKELTEVKQGSVFLETSHGENLLSNSEIEQIINYVSTC